MDIVPVPDASFIYDYTLRNPNVTLFGNDEDSFSASQEC
jgi:hypothetical protein